jgi:hypothetical protein
VPLVSAVDPEIFRRRYFGLCLSCTFCHDACCQYGVDLSVVERDRILADADRLEQVVGRPRAEWFTGVVTADTDFPGGAATRTAVVGDRCVFRLAGTRGCSLHAFALDQGRDYHDLKPMVSTLFPITFGDGALFCSEELVEGSLICAGDGPTAYEMARSELEYYFGSEMVAELDAIAALE